METDTVFVDPGILDSCLSPGDNFDSSWSKLQELTKLDSFSIGPNSYDYFFSSLDFQLLFDLLGPEVINQTIGRLGSFVLPESESSTQSRSEWVSEVYVHPKELIRELMIVDILCADAHAPVAICCDMDWWNSPIGVNEENLCYLFEDWGEEKVNVRRFSFRLGFDVVPREIVRYSVGLFPSLRIASSCHSGVGSLVGDEHDLGERLFHHLCVLNDFVFPNWQPDDLGNFFKKVKANGVLISGEGSNRHKDPSYMKRRAISVDNKYVSEFKISPEDAVADCELHAKIHPNQNRIYFAKYERFIFIGAIIKHL